MARLGSCVLLLVVVFIVGMEVTMSAAAAPFLAPVVKPGDTVGFISPASPIYYTSWTPKTYPEHINQTVSPLGLKSKFAPHCFEEYGYLAGTDQQRADDVMAMFKDPSVKMIVANRGGWGCNRFIDMLDYEVIARNPKVIMGYSDLTGLLNAIHTKTGLVTFHGPMGLDQWWSKGDGVSGKVVHQMVQQAAPLRLTNTDNVPIRTITSGRARGKLVGGNLSVFSAMIGSPYLTLEQMKGAILFLEEVGEEPYRIDRYLTQVQLAGYLKVISGFVFGRCTNCEASNKNRTLPLDLIIDQKIKPLGIPAFTGAMFGHDLDAQYTLPIGLEVEIDSASGTIQMLESAVRL